MPSPLVTLTILTRALIVPTAFGVMGIAEDGQGRVLLVRHSYAPGWRFPGGGVNRGEPAEKAVMRELEEEVGLAESTPPEFIGLYTRKVLWATNLIALYRVRNVRVDFKPNMEIREMMFCNPASPPPGTTEATRHRLAELIGKLPRSPYW